MLGVYRTYRRSKSLTYPLQYICQKRCISDYLSQASNAKTIQDFRELVGEMHRRRYNLQRIQFGLAGFSCVFAYLFYEKIVDWVSDQTTTVTSKSLDDPEFLNKIVEFGTQAGKRIVYNLSQDEDTKIVFQQFFSELFITKPIIGAASELSDQTVKKLLFDEQHEQLRQHIIQFALDGVHEIIEDKQLQHNAGNLVWTSFNKAFNPIVWVMYPGPGEESSDNKEKDSGDGEDGGDVGVKQMQ